MRISDWSSGGCSSDLKAIALDMQRFGVRSNAIAPFAWTRMIDSIPTDTPEQQKRVDGLKKLDADKIAPFVVALTSDDGAKVSGQIFAEIGRASCRERVCQYV